jgi:hypothetical protein
VCDRDLTGHHGTANSSRMSVAFRVRPAVLPFGKPWAQRSHSITRKEDKHQHLPVGGPVCRLLRRTAARGHSHAGITASHTLPSHALSVCLLYNQSASPPTALQNPQCPVRRGQTPDPAVSPHTSQVPSTKRSTNRTRTQNCCSSNRHIHAVFQPQ